MTLIFNKLLLFSGLCFLICAKSLAQDTTFIKVHFLYGSKPKKEYKDTEEKWFGGVMGGHVGIEVDPNKIVDFVPNGKFHWIAKQKQKNSRFVVHDTINFWEIFGGEAAMVKKSSFIIPVTKEQKSRIDSITKAYLSSTPYDYAFFGMRCAAAAYDILGQIGVVKPFGYRTTYLKIFYPKKLRKRLTKKAMKSNWRIIRYDGSERRIWKRDQ